MKKSEVLSDREKVSMRIILSGGWSYGNIGDEAIAYSTYSMVKKTWPEAEIIVLSYDTDNFQKHHAIRAMESVHKIVEKKSIAFSEIEAAVEDPMEYGLEEFASLFQNERQVLFLICGGGYWHEGWTSMYISKAIEIEMASKNNAKIAVIGQSIGPIIEGSLKANIKELLSKCHYINVRDNATFEFLQGIGVGENLILGVDTANVISDFIKVIKGGEEAYVNIMLSGYTDYVSMGSRIKKGKIKKFLSKCISKISPKRYLYYKRLSKFVCSLSQDLGLHLNFVMSTDWWWDKKAICRITKGIDKNKWTLYENLNMQDMCEILAKGKVIVSSKMHPLIISNSYEVPSIAISYNFKIDNYMKDIHREKYCYKNYELKSDNLVASVSNIISSQSEKGNPDALKEKVYSMFKDLNEIVSVSE